MCGHEIGTHIEHAFSALRAFERLIKDLDLLLFLKKRAGNFVRRGLGWALTSFAQAPNETSVSSAARNKKSMTRKLIEMSSRSRGVSGGPMPEKLRETECRPDARMPRTGRTRTSGQNPRAASLHPRATDSVMLTFDLHIPLSSGNLFLCP